MRNTRLGTDKNKKFGTSRFRALGIFTLLLSMTLQTPILASDAGKKPEDLIRAAMVYNFCKFVEWPAGKQNQNLVLGVLSNGFSGPDFSSIKGKSIKDLPLEVRQVTNEDDLSQCNLVYISSPEPMDLATAFATSRNESILTISEIDEFCSQGGIIQMVPRRGKTRFFINRKAAEKSGLTLSSQLLKMAKIVEGD